MIVNPSIYNGTGRLNYNYDPFAERRNTSLATKTNKSGYTNSLTNSINQAMNSAISKFSSNFQASLSGLKNATKNLNNPNSNAYAGRTTTENSKSFSVEASAGAKIGSTALSVTQLASAQKNSSKAYASDSKEFENTSYKLTIKKDNTSKAFDFSVKSGETYSTAMNRFAEEINSSKSGVTAKVTQDQYGYSKLAIESNETGKNKGFELEGTFADTFKLNDNEEQGKDLEYEVDGEKKTSSKNAIELDGGKVKVKVQGTNEKAENFTVKEDSTGMTNALKDFAKAYNAFAEASKDSSNPLTQSISKQFKNTIDKSLKKMDIEGISLNSDGKMTIDETALAASVKENYDSVKDAVMKFDSFAKTIERKTDNVLSSPISKYMPNIDPRQNVVKPFIYNYDRSSTLNNLNSFTSQGSIIDITL